MGREGAVFIHPPACVISKIAQHVLMVHSFGCGQYWTLWFMEAHYTVTLSVHKAQVRLTNSHSSLHQALKHGINYKHF